MLQQKPVESILSSVNWPTMMREMRPAYISKGLEVIFLWCYYKDRKNGATVIIVQPDQIDILLWHKSTLEVLQQQFYGNELCE